MGNLRKIAILDFQEFNESVLKDILRIVGAVYQGRRVLVKRISSIRSTNISLDSDYLLLICLPKITDEICSELRICSGLNRCLVIYDHHAKSDFQQLFQTSIQGLVNSHAISELPKAILELLNSRKFICQLTLREIVGETIMIDKGSNLSRRELEVLMLISKGLKYQEISVHLSISYDTTKTHIQNSYRKLGVKNKVEAVHKARTRMALFQNVFYGDRKRIISNKPK